MPPSVSALQCVAGLQCGRTAATETEPVKPVPDAYVDAILCFVPASVWGMIQLQRVTGMVPPRRSRADPSLLYRHDRRRSDSSPAAAQDELPRRERAIALGPQSQAIIRQFLPLDTQAYLFSPKRDAEERRGDSAAGGKLPSSPANSTGESPIRKSKRGSLSSGRAMPAPSPTVAGKPHAHFRACAAKKTKTAPALPQGGRITAVPVWSPNQLRHNFATMVRKQHGLEARSCLGHARANTTEIYADAI